MRVCFFHGEPDWSARARVFTEMAGLLAGRGYEITLVCARGGSAERRMVALGREVIGLSMRGGALRVGWRLRGILRRQFVEVVFVHSEREQLAAATAVWLADRGAVVRRVPPVARLTGGRRARLGMRLAATGFLFAFDEDLRAARAPARALEPVVAPPGAAPAAPAAPVGGAANGARTVVVICDRARDGRLATALRALALLAERQPELKIVLIGAECDRDALRIQAAALRIGGRVAIVDTATSGETAREQIAAAALGWVVADGDEAAFGMLDFLSAGVPVITERNALSTRLVTDGATGMLASGLDATGYAALLARLLAEPDVRAALARAARESSAKWPLSATADGFERAAAAARDRTRWHV